MIIQTYQGSLHKLYCIVTSRTKRCCRNAFYEKSIQHQHSGQTISHPVRKKRLYIYIYIKHEHMNAGKIPSKE